MVVALDGVGRVDHFGDRIRIPEVGSLYLSSVGLGYMILNESCRFNKDALLLTSC